MKAPQVGDKIHVMTALQFIVVGEVVTPDNGDGQMVVKNVIGEEQILVNTDMNHSLRPGGGPLRTGEWEYVDGP